MSELTEFGKWCRQQSKIRVVQTAADIELWTRLADEVDRYVALDPDVVVLPTADDVALFEDESA